MIPTPSLAEVLVRAEKAAPTYLTELTRSKHFSVKDFDVLAAVEHAEIQRKRLASKLIPRSATRNKAKFDDQIVAISRVAGVTTIYTNDGDIKKLAMFLGVTTIGIKDLPLPPESSQPSFDFNNQPNSEQQETDDATVSAGDDEGLSEKPS